MENVLKALGKNRLNSDSEQDGRSKPGRNGILSSTEDSDTRGDDTEIMESVAVGKDIDGDDNIKQSVSIDCTKALVILGFSNWTELEPGMQYTIAYYVYTQKKIFCMFC